MILHVTCISNARSGTTSKSGPGSSWMASSSRSCHLAVLWSRIACDVLQRPTAKPKPQEKLNLVSLHREKLFRGSESQTASTKRIPRKNLEYLIQMRNHVNPHPVAQANFEHLCVAIWHFLFPPVNGGTTRPHEAAWWLSAHQALLSEPQKTVAHNLAAAASQAIPKYQEIIWTYEFYERMPLLKSLTNIED